MLVRIVVADVAEARFYDIARHGGPMRPAGRLEDPSGRLHDRDLVSDRPGRVFDRAPPRGGRRGSVAHHGVGGEGNRRPRKHAAQSFARRIARELEHARQEGQFARIVLMAGPAFLGMLRSALPKSLDLVVAAEIPKDLVHETDESVQAHLPREVFSAPA
jgi:protein required for attachment to host cells